MIAPSLMTRDDLIEQMKLEGIPLHMLSTQTSVPSGCFGIREGNGAWETFYAERGLETGLSIFSTEDAACNALLDEMREYAIVSDYI